MAFTVAAAVVATAAVGVVPNFGPGFNATKLPNMNGAYVHSATPGAKGMETLFPKQFADYPGGVEMVEVYGPAITTLYSQVWWAPLAPAPFPEWFTKKYDGKPVAVVGWEIDQVRKGAGPKGEDVSVPITASYNHHYNLNLIGKNSRFKKVMLSGPNDPNAELLQQQGHGGLQYDEPHYIVEQVNETASGYPSSAFITSGNGGEYRKTLHAYPPGYAVVLDSPTAVSDQPMQIDTWNRDEMDINGPLPPKFVPGPLPAASQAPTVNPKYSGLLECPMTTRLTKNIDGTYAVQSIGRCTEDILTFQECFHAAATTMSGAGLRLVNSSGSDATRPAGCSVTVSPKTPFELGVFFNKLDASSVGCAAEVKATVASAQTVVAVTVALASQATITVTGPSTVWFGVGFNASSMPEQPWTLIVDGNGAVTERKLGNHEPGTLLKPSVTVVSNTVVAGKRTVVITRPLAGATADYYTFSILSTDATVNFISAVGSGPAFAYHKERAIGTMTFLPTNGTSGACVCPEAPKPFGLASGQMTYHKTNQTGDVGTGAVGFRAGKCANYPATTLITQQNPTCDIRHYRGGQWACHHMWSLLDADQPIPWPDQPLVFHHKYRFYVQPLQEQYHQPVTFLGGAALLIGSPYEYDVPACADGVPGCTLVDGTWIHTITGSKIGRSRFVSLNFHCHAPTCLMMSVYACPNGTALDDCAKPTTVAEAEAKGYELLCRQEPAYGGSDNAALNGTRFDEPGYIAIPDCFWGSPEQGLELPRDLTGTPLFMIKTANASIGHYGEMAGGQPFGY
mmetsp:Transcript_23795/g.62253  ORF Transcript_23795/g.62253 Transcript_23795/m.62253 type:complete len:793 (-) Transcript_23795:139-2517(-)|eukprot:CAMPEP_0182934604 /NCGR_PEP_ID=MMETSP0105_2-20130417/36435_1 /TAXON_ID=81532 ORGANISM="Acanthoeca-like sp., Strain 10tr" /NCGR_SAMPLE_ID=MMETSP0105_2 /ASSEMBLY_ACC=CAM_ASM_000205 /LENGTH=792 /DNA_ID=CAMNT_0025073469 /DNA_START=116 /DNA_END=2494 /DNA_ORIENTATION=-